jgi:hypothetical protein
VISEVELYRINIVRKRAGLRLLSMAQARRAVEANANITGTFEMIPFLVKYAAYEEFPEQHDAVVATPSADFSPSSSDTSSNGGDGW